MLNEKLNFQSLIKIIKINSEKHLIYELNKNRIITYSSFLKKSLEFSFFFTKQKKTQTRGQSYHKIRKFSRIFNFYFCMFFWTIRCMPHR